MQLPDTIEVTAQHIDIGIADDCTQCPIALAIQDVLFDTIFEPGTDIRIEVHEDETHIGEVLDDSDYWKQLDHYTHDPDIMQWIEQFDMANRQLSFAPPIPLPITINVNHKEKRFSYES